MSIFLHQKWSTKTIPNQWGPTILTKIDQRILEIHGENSGKKEVEYVFLDELDKTYKAEFLDWLSENNISLYGVNDYIKKLNEIVIEESTRYAINLDDWKDWLKWKIGITKTKKKPTGIVPEI